jgi:hypothetical protein
MSFILNHNFWFNPGPGHMSLWAERVMIAVVAISLIAAIVFYLLKMKGGFNKYLWGKLIGFFSVNAIAAAVLFFLNYELIIFLSARAWFLVWWLLMIIWAIFIIKYAKTLPAKKEQAAKEKEYKKYLP